MTSTELPCEASVLERLGVIFGGDEDLEIWRRCRLKMLDRNASMFGKATISIMGTTRVVPYVHVDVRYVEVASACSHHESQDANDDHL
jgi:hypothetical protein